MRAATPRLTRRFGTRGGPRPVLVLGVLLAATLLVTAPTAAFELWRYPDGTPNVVKPAITAQPIRVVMWVRNTVSSSNETWATGQIRDALALWEDVPTAHVRFTASAVRSATRPATTPETLLVIVANQAEISAGGATGPNNGYPGTWFGAVADYRSNCDPPTSCGLTVVAAHEIGHTLGLLHSTVSDEYFGARNIPVMHWAVGASKGLTADDVAAISTAYPEPTRPLESTTGTLRGVCGIGPAVSNSAERTCQQTISSALSGYAVSKSICIATCDAARQGGAARACDASAAYDAQTAACIERAEAEAKFKIITKCDTTYSKKASCPACIDAKRNCNPNSGFSEWVAAGIQQPLTAAQRNTDSLSAQLYCDDAGSSDGLTSAEALCRRQVAVQIERSARAIRRCYEKCNTRRQNRTLAAGTTCVPGAANLDPKTAACIQTAATKAASKFGCHLPDCAPATATLTTLTRSVAERYSDALYCDAPPATAPAVDGVNVVAISRASGAPVVGRLSGVESVPGAFNLVGLPPGKYDLAVLDGRSFAGTAVGLPQEQIQTDSFTPYTAGPYTVKVGQVTDLGNVMVPIEAISIDSIAIGSNRFTESGVDPSSGALPPGKRVTPYQTWLHVRGGVRPLLLESATGLPAGVGTVLFSKQEANAAYSGEYFVEVVGTPQVAGNYAPRFQLADAHGTSATLSFTLAIAP